MKRKSYDNVTIIIIVFKNFLDKFQKIPDDSNKFLRASMKNE